MGNNRSSLQSEEGEPPHPSPAPPHDQDHEDLEVELPPPMRPISSVPAPEDQLKVTFSSFSLEVNVQKSFNNYQKIKPPLNCNVMRYIENILTSSSLFFLNICSLWKKI